MEFNFNINNLFGETISYVDSNLKPFRNLGHENLRENLEKVIDEMGRASAKAQSLNSAITTSYKMQYSDHHLYVMKDSEANGGRGSVLGILRVGQKTLFVLDNQNIQHEMKPICVLDFYVHESCQRKGFGKQLFQHMLNRERIKAQHLAIDRPSKKFTAFLQKHYKLRATITQVNNFVIFDGFFQNQPEESYLKKKSTRHPPRPPNHSVQQSGYRNASNSALWTHQTNSRPSSTAASPNDQQRDMEKAAVWNVRPQLNGSISSQGSTENHVLSDLDISTRGVAFSRYNTRSETPPSRTGSGRSRHQPSPITGSTTPAKNTPPLYTQPKSLSRDNTPPPFGMIGSNQRQESATRNGHLKMTPQATAITTVTASTNSNTIKPGQITSPLNSGVGTMSVAPQTSRVDQTNITRDGNYCLNPTATPMQMHSSWNVLGIPPSHQQRQSNQSQSSLYGRNNNFTQNRFF